MSLPLKYRLEGPPRGGGDGGGDVGGDDVGGAVAAGAMACASLCQNVDSSEAGCNVKSCI